LFGVFFSGGEVRESRESIGNVFWAFLVSPYKVEWS
jgi:hypothetical protein